MGRRSARERMAGFFAPLVAAGLLVLSGPAFASQPLAPGGVSRFALTAHDETIYSFRLPRGQYAEVEIQQLGGLLQALPVELDGAKRTPVTLDAGRTSIIRVPFTASASGSYSVRLSCRVPLRGSCTGAISMSRPQAASGADLLRAHAERLLARAEYARKKGKKTEWPAALERYDEAINAAKSIHDPEMLRAALTGKARLLLYDLNNYRAAAAAAQLATGVSTPGQDTPDQALAWKTLGGARYYLGEYAGSIRSGQRALAIYRTLGDEYWQGIIEGNLAYKYKEIGDTDHGLTAAGTALKIARSIGDGYGIDFALETLGALHLARGELESAFDSYHQALDALQKQPYPDEAGAVWNGFGELYLQLNDPQRAEESFRKALAISIQAHDTAGELNVLGNLGDVELRQRNAAAALEFFQRGIATAKALGLAPEQSSLLTGLGASYAMLHRPGRAIESYRQAIAISRKIFQHDSEAAAFEKLGDLDYALGRRAAARLAYEQSGRLWRGQDNRARTAAIEASLARLDGDAGNLITAREEIRNALDLIESFRSTLMSRDLRTSYFASKHDYYELAVNILMRLNRRYPHRGYDALAFEVAERAKARTLLDVLQRNHADTAAGLPPALAARQQRLRERLDAAYARLTGLDESGAPRPGERGRIRRLIEDLLKEQDDVEARIRSSSPRYAALARGRPVDVAAVENLTTWHTALLEYWAGRRNSFLWVFSGSRLMSFTLPSAARLQRQVEAYRRDLLARAQYLPGEGFLHRHARVAEADARLPEEESQLGAELLGPWEASRKVRLLLIVPDGPLWSLPFDSLRIPIAGRVNLAGRDQSDRSLNPHTFQYALARFEIAEEPSASVLLSLIHRRRKIPAQSRVAIFADPVYSSIDPRVGGRAELARVKLSEGSSLRSPPTRWVAEAGMAELARLKGSRREALQIASLAGAGDSKVYLGFAAQPEAVKSMKWSRFRVAHFAAHAMVNSRNPALSGIVLTMISRTGAPEDGVLWLHNIYLLHMPVSLVVLSGCGTATGEDIPGEGVAGFARAFFFAGAQRVIGSLWSIEDEPTAALMRAFYVNLLKRGQSAAASLRAAQLAIAGTKGTDAPYFWAGFILQGLGR